MHARYRLVLLVTAALLASVLHAGAQTTASAPENTASASTAAAQPDDPDLDPNRAQPDFTLLALPTSLRLPRHKMAFRVTHRFARDLGDGGFDDLASDLFGLDSGAQIGLEFRYGLIRGGQIGIYRTSDRTINFFGQYEVLSQKKFPVGITAVASIDGTNNFQDSYTPSLSAVLSREVGDRAAFYLQPAWVNNVDLEPSELVDHNDAFVLGVGARVNVHGHTYLVFETAPRISGYDEGEHHVSFGLEQQVGGHMFQINFSNGIGTTLGQITRGATKDWYLGFAITRKFY